MICVDCARGADLIAAAAGGEMLGEHLRRDGIRLHARCRNREAGQALCPCQHRVPSKTD